jgi:hypothetical protein
MTEYYRIDTMTEELIDFHDFLILAATRLQSIQSTESREYLTKSNEN